MENKDLKIKIEEQLNELKEKIKSNDKYKEIKYEQKILNGLLKQYLEEEY